MAIQVTLYTIEKKANSTYSPVTAGKVGTNFQCNLFEECSLTHPKLIFTTATNADKMTGYNYAYIPDFSRQYFISDWNYSGGRWVATLTIDVLASWRAEIGNGEHYILRSSNTYDGGIMDTKYPTTANIIYGYSLSGSVWDTRDFSQGTYIISAVASLSEGVSENVGSVAFWAFTHDQLKTLIKALMNDIDIGDSATYDRAIIKLFADPTNYITSCRWYPMSLDKFSVETIPVFPYGYSAMELSCNRLQSLIASPFDFFREINIPKHPQISRGKYLTTKPFSAYSLECRPWGCIELDGAYMFGDTLSYAVKVDVTTGIARLDIITENENGQAINLPPFEAKIGIDVPLTSLTSFDFRELANFTMGNVSSVVTGNFPGIVNGGIEAVTNYLSPDVRGNVNIGGSVISMTDSVKLRAVFYSVTDESRENFGRPLAQVRRIKDIPGYIVCGESNISIPATDVEISEIKSYLTGGFFYE